MSGSTDHPTEREVVELRAKILTVSGSVHRGLVADRGGSVVGERLARAGFSVTERRVVPDGIDEVAEALRGMCEGFTGLIVTTGGTGFSPDDLTPEGTRAVLDRLAPGLSEAMRGANPLGRLSRAIAGTRGRAVVINTPGSPSGAAEYLDAVIDVLPHAVALVSGVNPHPHGGVASDPHPRLSEPTD